MMPWGLLLNKYVLGALGVAVVLGAIYAWHLSIVHEKVAANDEGWKVKIAQEQAVYAKKVSELQNKQAEVVTKTVTVYRDRVKVIKEKGDEIIRQAPSLVGTECALTGGMRVLHDSSASGHMPDDPIGAARAAAPVDAVTLGTTVAQNYATCRTEITKLASLQQLVISLKELK